MKKIITLCFALIVTIGSFATVRTVSSNPSTLGQFSTIQAAIDASGDSDTVYVYGSPNVYPAFTISDKKITVIGPGWAPDKNLPLQAIVTGVIINNSAAGGSPDGSELQGLVFTSTAALSQSGGTNSGTNNIRVIRCQFNSTVGVDLSSNGFLFEGCYFNGLISFSTSQTYQNFLFQNNLFFFSVCCQSNQFQGLTNSVNIRLDHNLFYSSNNASGSNASLFNTNCRFLTLSNNIFNQANAGNVSFSTFNNNITNNATLNTANATANNTPWAVNSNIDGGGNVSNQNPAMADQTGINGGSSNPLLNFTIASGPANNSGSDGKDIGLLFDTTGSLNWNNSRNSRLPRIFSMNITTPTVTPGGNLSVTVDARKSN